MASQGKTMGSGTANIGTEPLGPPQYGHDFRLTERSLTDRNLNNYLPETTRV